MTDVAPDLLKSSVAVERFDIGGVRWYSPLVTEDTPWNERKLRPSVTSVEQVISKGPIFNRWMIGFPSYDVYREHMAHISLLGTITHDLIDKLIRGEKVELEGMYWDRDGSQFIDLAHPKYQKPLQGFLIAFLKFWQEKNPTPLASEIMLFDDEVGGTADFVALIKYRNNDKIALFDWKTRLGPPITGDHPAAYEHGIQLTKYATMWNGQYVDQPVELLYNVYLGERGGFKLKPREYNLSGWNCALNLWINKQGGEMPKEPIQLPTEFSLYEAQDGISEDT